MVQPLDDQGADPAQPSRTIPNDDDDDDVVELDGDTPPCRRASHQVSEITGDGKLVLW